MCLTCGFEIEIDLADATGASHRSAESEHMKFDGAHYANWLGADTQSPDERRDALGIVIEYDE